MFDFDKEENKVLITGVVQNDVKLFSTPTGVPVCNFVLSRPYAFEYGLKKESRTMLCRFDCEAWNGTAQTISQAIKKGTLVRVIGKLRQDRWLDINKHWNSRVKIVVESIEFGSSEGA